MDDGQDDPVWGRQSVADLSRHRAAQKAKSSKDGGGADRPSKRWLMRSTQEWDESDLAPRPWLAPGYLMRQSVTLLGGAPSAGKSLVAIMWAVASALGRPVGKFRPPGALRVSYYAVEDDELEFRKRVSAALRYFGMHTRDMEGRLERIHPTDDPDLFKWGISEDGRTFELVNTDAWGEIEAGIEDFRPDIFIFDPLVELNSAPENDNAAQRAVIARFRTLARRHDLCPLIVDHARKQGLGEVDAGDADRIRGASSKIGAARNVLTCSVMSSGEATKFGVAPAGRLSYCQVVGAKANYAAKGSVEWFEKVEHTLERGEITPCVQPWIPPSAPEVEQDTLDVIAFEVSRGWDGEPFGCRLDSSDRSLRQLLQRHGIEKRGETTVLAALEKAGFRKQAYRSPRTRRAVIGWRGPKGTPVAKWLVAREMPDGTQGWAEDDDANRDGGAIIYGESAIRERESAIVAEQSRDDDELFSSLF